MKVIFEREGFVTREYDVNHIGDAMDKFWEEIVEYHYKWNATVVDNDGNLITRFYVPYEGLLIHSAQVDALETIRDDYDIPREDFRRMCEQWLADNPKDAE